MIDYDFVLRLRDLGVEFRAEGDRLFLSGPKEALTPEMLASIKDQKEEIVKLIHQAEESCRSELQPIERRRDSGNPPLSFSQQRLWFLEQLQPGMSTYNMSWALRLKGALAPDIFEKSLNEVIRRHEILRTVFRKEGDRPVQVILPYLTISVAHIDFRGEEPGEHRDNLLSQLFYEKSKTPFNLEAGPLIEASLYMLADNEHILFLKVHHLIFDGWSYVLFLNELFSLYETTVSGQSQQHHDLPIQFADFSLWQRKYHTEKFLEPQLRYWKKKLAGDLTGLAIPFARPRPVVQSFNGAQEWIGLPRELVKSLKELGQKENAGFFMVLLSVFKILLLRYTGQDDICVGSPAAGRTHPQTESMIGFFIQTLALRTDLSGKPDFMDVLRRVRQVVLEAQENQDVPFERIVEALAPQRDIGVTPLFQIFFNHITSQVKTGLNTGLLHLSPFWPYQGEIDSKFDLTCYVEEMNDDARVRIVYNTDLFRSDSIVLMLQYYKFLLEQIVISPQLPITKYSLVDKAASQVLPDPAAVLTAVEVDKVHRRFSQNARRYPNRLAIVDSKGNWEYEGLDRCSNGIAHHLRSKGIKEGDVVAVYGRRNSGLVLAALGIFKAGAVLLVLDPEYPAERLKKMITAASPSAVILIEGESPPSRSFVDFVDSLALKEVLQISGKKQELTRFTADGMTIPVENSKGLDDTACILFTSGTTGQPTGIISPHGPLSHFIDWHCREFSLRESDRFSMLSGLSHDPLLRDIFTPLWLGATLCIPEYEDIFIPGRLMVWLKSQQITIAHLTPAMGKLLMISDKSDRSEEDSSVLPELQYVFFGGDVLTKRVVEGIRQIAPAATLINYYGATETPQAMGYFRIDEGAEGREPDDPDVGGIVPVGRGIDGVQLLVVNSEGNLAGVGESGEISIRTPYLAKGYLNDEVLTKNRFVRNPFNFSDSVQIFKTGDRGRYLTDGNVLFCGRFDDQVSIRGFRVEPGEIEEVLARHPDLEDCAVVACENSSREKYLAAYVIASEAQDINVISLRDHLNTHLPNYMIPSVFVPLQVLPLTPNGKLDHHALPNPKDFAESKWKKSFEPPGNPTEKALAAIWSQVLKVGKVSIHDNFFQLGGHSLLAIQLISRIRGTFAVEIPLRAVFEFSSVKSFAAYIDEELKKGMELLVPAITRISRQNDMPLSYSQERMWFLQQLIPESTAYNMSSAVEIEGPFEPELLRQSLYLLSRQHESLRTTFSTKNGRPMQHIADKPSFFYSIKELADTPTSERRKLAIHECAIESGRSFNLSTGPLLKVIIYCLAEDKHILQIVLHHSISDLWSLRTLGRQLSFVYELLEQGEKPLFPEKSIDYADFAGWQKKWLNDEVLEPKIAFWRNRLSGLPILELPIDKQRPAQWSGRGARISTPLSSKVCRQIKSYCSEESVTPFMFMLTIFYILLWRYSGQSDIASGIPVANRNREETEDIIGTFVNTLVLRADLSGDPFFQDLLSSVRDEALAAFSHQDVPFEKLIEAIQPQRDMSFSPLVQVLFNLDNTPHAAPSSERRSWFPLLIDRGAAQLDLTMYVNLQYDESIVIEYATDLFEAETIDRLLNHYLTLLSSALASPEKRISEITFLNDIEQREILHDWNQTGVPYPKDASVSRLFEEHADRTPDAVAVMFEAETMSYAELDARSNQVAHFLRAAGVIPGTIVGIYMDRSLEMLVGLIGIMKSGAAYLPLDPAFPEDRIGFMIKDSGAPLILTRQHLVPGLGDHDAEIVCIDAGGEKIRQFPATCLKEKPEAENLSYVIYTSGSTGLPKGVKISNRALMNFLCSMRKTPGLEPSDVVLAETTLSFDIAGLELFLPLITGAGIALVDKETGYDGIMMQQAIERYGVTVVQATPATWRILLESGWQGSSRLKALCGGEAMPRELATFLLPRCKELWNMYGPTETTIWSTVSKIESVSEPILIGRPIANTTIYILDKNLHPVPIGVPGELHIGGDGLAGGYLNREELSSEKFIPSPFSNDSDTRLYKTGDLARYKADGRIECLGRLDHQVKIHGFRIELGEIETRLSENPAVRKNVVMAREDSPGEKYLAAYIVPESEMETSSRELQRYLHDFLPDYMVPTAYEILNELPLTPNGKIDRRALPIPQSSRQASPDEAFEAPRTPLEEEIARIWQEALGVESISIHDSFFRLGGHSLLATRVVAKLSAGDYALEVPVRYIFEYPTIAGLADAIMLDMISAEEDAALPEILDSMGLDVN